MPTPPAVSTALALTSNMSTNFSPSSGWATWMAGPPVSITPPHDWGATPPSSARNAAAEGLAEPSAR